ncbi:hypothetical protein PRIC1_007595 [Phytophthora ramorum]|nr:hypothetical protein KRP22_7906 [Phytophthora ramorum]
MEERFDRAWLNFAWGHAVNSLVPTTSRWHSLLDRLVRTQDAIGDSLAAALRDAAKKARGDMDLVNLGWDLVKRLLSYEQEPRFLVKLADTERVMKVLEKAVKTSLDVLNIHDSETANLWWKELQREREVDCKCTKLK